MEEIVSFEEGVRLKELGMNKFMFCKYYYHKNTKAVHDSYGQNFCIPAPTIEERDKFLDSLK